ncbi:MAG: response regulator [Deltaproteobacteria bacterium]|nr:response regulator [Deltaproteobacteria bacterium]
MGNNKKVVVIDDNAEIRRVIELKLRTQGYKVITAANGKEGLNLIKSKQPDVVITDIVMPEKEGIEVITEVRRDFPNVKIIAMSGGGLIGPHEYLSWTKMMGVQRTFTKPFAINEILEAVNELVG